MQTYCTRRGYVQLMKEQCQRTCGYCRKYIGSCFDMVNPQTGVNDCSAMKFYCTNYGYVLLMKEQCPKTYGYCRK
ncbi:unnamed protein product [Angiostrongylus costaricensis]|uniref:ShKT domain-containing protein n=1 Tax=Angiostrongylus costaricensis TaxID=334426 RepID=A0A158PGX6_ANGCS|nr:unnamed protein product [Angiostrongylus costaricensis]